MHLQCYFERQPLKDREINKTILLVYYFAGAGKECEDVCHFLESSAHDTTMTLRPISSLIGQNFVLASIFP